jgi:cytochrome c-type biogenesis protein CcmH
MVAVMGLVVTLALGGPSAAQPPDERARSLEGKLIAPCCWTQPVSQHYSDAADRMRKEIREMLAAGSSEQQVLDHYVAQYGERILASPRARGFNMLAYILPWFFLAAAGTLLVLLLRHWRQGKIPAGAAAQTASTEADPYAERIEQELREFERSR